MPVACAAIPMRPPSSVERAILYPSPSFPMRFASGTSQSVNESSVQAVAWMPSFFSSLPHFESGRAAFDHQRSDSFFAFCGIGVHIDDRSVGHAAIGDPRLRAVDDVAVALEHRVGRERRRIRASLRFGERVAADFFAAREGREEFLFLLVSCRSDESDRNTVNFAPTE